MTLREAHDKDAYIASRLSDAQVVDVINIKEEDHRPKNKKIDE
jgi:hypothetical protein